MSHKLGLSRCCRKPLAAIVALLATVGVSGSLAVASEAALPAACSKSAQTVTCTYTSGSNPFVVPAGISSIHVVAVGGTGGSSPTGNVGGGGAAVTGDLAVSAGTTVYAVVGSNGGNGGGSGFGGGGGTNGGGLGAPVFAGGGGGASDVRRSQDDLSSRMLVAAGGGGAGGPGGFVVLEPPIVPEFQFSGGVGGAGGGYDGTGFGLPYGGGGGRGGGSSGGAGGSGCPPTQCNPPGTDGSAGSSGVGGDGGGGGGFLIGPIFFFGGGGGGGGGGVFGGGGGGGGSGEGGGGGGGGSNLAPPGGSQSIDMTGTPLVEISYTLHPTATSVSCAPSTVVAGRSTTCTATVTDTASTDQTAPAGTVALTTGGPGSFTAGGQCTLAPAGGGSASCSVEYTPASTTGNPNRSDGITAAYGGDDTHTTSHSATQETVISPTALASGSFVIGDQNATVGTAVTFWGARWSALNGLSGGSAPARFKGFASHTPNNPPQCGDQWTTAPGDSSTPPASVPQYMEVTVASQVAQRGSTISGDTEHVVVVKTNPGYGPEPDQPGTGTVVAQAC